MGTFDGTAIVDYRLWFAALTKDNKVRFPFPFAANKRKFFVSVFRWQKTNGNCHFSLVLFSDLRNSENEETWTCRNGDMETWR
jgi:hypothetical protein